jgi:hypothetical protein
VLATVAADDPDVAERIRRRLRSAPIRPVRNVLASGAIDLHPCLATARGYERLLRWRDMQARRGRRPSTVAHELTVASYALVHEFGHLLDVELRLAGEDVVDEVFSIMSTAVLGRTPSSRRAYHGHLWNYPSSYRFDGPAATTAGRRRSMRRAIGPAIAAKLGSHAAADREELFAESFVAMWAATDPNLRRELRPMWRILRTAGLARRPGPRVARRRRGP